MESGQIAIEIMEFMLKKLEFCISEFGEICKTKDRNIANELINDTYTQWESSYSIGLALLTENKSIRKIFQEYFKIVSNQIDEMYKEIQNWE